MNVALTDLSAFIVNAQEPTPGEQSPDHPAKVDPFVGTAVNVT